MVEADGCFWWHFVRIWDWFFQYLTARQVKLIDEDSPISNLALLMVTIWTALSWFKQADQNLVLKCPFWKMAGATPSPGPGCVLCVSAATCWGHSELEQWFLKQSYLKDSWDSWFLQFSESSFFVSLLLVELCAAIHSPSTDPKWHRSAN